MRTPDAVRQRRARRRQRLGLRMVQVEISEEFIELLEKRGYDPRRDSLNRACGNGAAIGSGPGRGLGALDLLDGEFALEDEAQVFHGGAVDTFLGPAASGSFADAQNAGAIRSGRSSAASSQGQNGNFPPTRSSFRHHASLRGVCERLASLRKSGVASEIS